MRRARLFAAVLQLLALSIPAGQAVAQAQAQGVEQPVDSALERRTRNIALMLRCPVCLNLSVGDSPSQLAQDMRNLVRERLAAGETDQQVLNYFVQRYGEWVLMKPTARGVNLLVWVLPALVVVGGGALVILVMKRWTRRPAAEAAVLEDIPESDLRKVRDALSRERANLD